MRSRIRAKIKQHFFRLQQRTSPSVTTTKQTSKEKEMIDEIKELAEYGNDHKYVYLT